MGLDRLPVSLSDDHVDTGTVRHAMGDIGFVVSIVVLPFVVMAIISSSSSSSSSAGETISMVGGGCSFVPHNSASSPVEWLL